MITNEAIKKAALLNLNFPSAAEDKDVQEALSGQWGDRRIILLPLSSGKIAVFNGAGELCSIIKGNISFILETWKPPKQDPSKQLYDPDLLEELGL